VLKEYNIIANGDARHLRFEKELSILSRISHPLIVRIEAVFYDGIHFFIHMPYYEHGTLADWLYGPRAHDDRPREVVRPPWQIQHVLQQVLQGLAFLHQNRIVHRDIKVRGPLSLSLSLLVCVWCGVVLARR
jgi:serine/threonine protein kinase